MLLTEEERDCLQPPVEKLTLLWVLPARRVPPLTTRWDPLAGALPQVRAPGAPDLPPLGKHQGGVWGRAEERPQGLPGALGRGCQPEAVTGSCLGLERVRFGVKGPLAGGSQSATGVRAWQRVLSRAHAQGE